MQTIEEDAVKSVFASYPETHRKHLLRLRELIVRLGSRLEETGGLQETLKWGQPSYLPVKAKVGSTVRLGVFDDDRVALYFHCQAMLVERFRTIFGDALTYEKNRALLFDLAQPLPEPEIETCVRHALYYHLDKKR